MMNEEKRQQSRTRFARVVTSRMEQLEMTVPDLARKAGVGTPTIINVLNGRFSADITLVYSIMDALNLRFGYTPRRL